MRYNEDKANITCKLGAFTKIKRHYKVHRAYLCMGGHIRDIYINGEVRSYVCVQRKGINNKLAIGQSMKRRADIETNGIRVRFSPINRKDHRLKHRGRKIIQVTTF